MAFVSVATAQVPTWHGAPTGTASRFLASTGAEGAAVKHAWVRVVLLPHGHSERRALHVLLFNADQHPVDAGLLGGVGNPVGPILVVLHHRSDWTVFLIFRDNCDLNVVSSPAHVVSRCVLTKQGEGGRLPLAGSVEIFSLKDTFGWIDLFGVDGPVHLIATAPACFLLRREAYLVVDSGAGAVLDLVQLREPLHDHALGDEDLQVGAAGQQVLGELHARAHVRQQLLQLRLLQLQGVLLLQPDVFQLLQQPVPVLFDGLDVALGERPDVGGHRLHSLLDGTPGVFDLGQGPLQGLHAGLGVFEEFPHGVPMLVDDVAGEVTGVLPVRPHRAVSAHRLVAQLTEQPQLLRGVSGTQDGFPKPAEALQVFEVHHGVVSRFLLPPMRLAAETAQIGFAGLTPLLHVPVAAQVTHQALAFPTQTLQHHIIHGQVVYG